jgi:lysophospholipase L1-like esterase
MSIDDYAGGRGRGAASLLFANHDERFPDWRGRDLASAGLADNFVLLARDGATSSDVAGRQLAALDDLAVVPVVLTVSMGGNDLLSVFGDTPAARAAITRLLANAGTVLSGLRHLVGTSVPIALATVYDPSDGSSEAVDVGLGPWSEASELVRELNDALRAVAAAHDVAVAEVHQRFLGHGLSVGDPSQAEAEPANRSLWYCGTVEPNAWGASEVRAAFWQALDGPWRVPTLA